MPETERRNRHPACKTQPPITKHFQVSWHLSCGSGFPAATIEAERLCHKKQNLMADNVTPGVMPR
jgi:hypothetical protein